MPTPLFNFRLPEGDASTLREVAKVYGSPNASAFVREMVISFCSGDPDQARAFVGRLFARMGEQMQLPLKSPRKAPKRPKARKRPGRGGSPP